MKNLTDTVGAVNWPHATDAKHIYHTSRQLQHQHRQGVAHSQSQSQERHTVSERWAYVPGQSFEIRLYGQDPMYLSLPLDESHARHGMAPCTVAVRLAKRLSESSHYTNGVMRRALGSFLEGDYYAALELYDEAAELGVRMSHYNSVYLSEELMKTACGGNGNVIEMEWWDALGSVVRNIVGVGLGSSHGHEHGHADTLGFDNQRQCKRNFQRVLSRRYMHLSNVAADPVATREIASQLLEFRYPFDGVGGTDPPGSGSGDGASPSPSEWRPSVEQAVRLYAYQAIQGDVHSLVTLGWAFQSGSIAGIPKNLTAAKSIFASAKTIELSTGSGSGKTVSVSTVSGSGGTMGVAPFIGEIYVEGQMWIESQFGSNLSPQPYTYPYINASTDMDVDNLAIVVLSTLFCFLVGLWYLRRRS